MNCFLPLRDNKSTKTLRIPRPGRRHGHIALHGSTALAGFAGTLALLVGSAAYALPVSGVVSSGAATISNAVNALTVTQSSQNAAINWQSFGIGTGESVRFVQPNNSSVALNRVVGSDPSSILGSLSANGKIFLVNPNGILFAPGSQVNVAGFVGAAADITDANFMAGQYKFTGGGAVLNQGSISADGGYVALLGASVSNTGTITAKMGAIALAAGNAMTLDVAGDGLLNVVINEGALNALVQNSGIISAAGGQVTMTAVAAGGLLRTVVNNSGIIEAQSLDNHNGTITLLGDMRNGAVAVDGTLDVSGRRVDQSGGTIVVTGESVSLLDGAQLDATGDVGGGKILVGGGIGGMDGSVPNAANVHMAVDAKIAADAISAGDGGKVVLWSTERTDAFGTISARGGALTGNGGFVETSGRHVSTGPGTSVTTLAPGGTTGLWLVDPVDYTIAGAGGDETPAQVTLSLAASDRLIVATHDITVASAVTWVTPRTLELRAGNDIFINAAMTASTAGSAIKLTAGHDIFMNAAMTASAIGSIITLAAGHDAVLTAAMTATALGAGIRIDAGHNVNQTGPAAALTSSGGGSIILRGDTDGTGGTGGGTVILAAPAAVVSDAVTVFYSPENGYGSPNTYAGIALAGFNPYMWVIATAQNKVYDGSTAATVTLLGDPTVGGTVAVSLSGGSATFNTKDVGNAKPVTVAGGGALVGAGAARYSLFTGAGASTANITPAPLSITADNGTKVYGQTFSGTGSISGLVNGESAGSLSFVSAGSAATASVAGGPYSIVAVFGPGGNYDENNYAVSIRAGTLTVTPAALTVTANNVTKPFGESIALGGTAFTAAGLRNGETIGSVSETSPGTAATASVAGGPYLITASNATGGSFTPSNYALSYVNGALTITPGPLLITANDVNKTYGQVAVLGGTAFTATGLRNGETIGSVTEISPGSSAAASVAGGPYVITPSNATGGTFTPTNYVLSYVNGALSVAPAALVITANDVSKSYGQAVTLGGTAFTTTGLVNGDSIGSVTETSAGVGATATVAGTPYAIVPTSAAGGTFTPANYAISYVNGALRIIPAALVVTGNDATKIYGSTITFNGSEFTSTGLKNGETIGSVTETSAGAAATASVAAAPYTIVTSGAVGGTFNLANYNTTYVNGTLRVTPAPLVVTANDAHKYFLQVLTFAGTEFTTTGLKNGETVTAVTLVSPGAAATGLVTPQGSPITPSNAIGTFSAGNYATTYVNGKLTVDPPLSTIDSASKAYGQVVAFTGPRFTVDGLSTSAPIDRSIRPTAIAGLPVLAPRGVNLTVIGDGVNMPPPARLAEAQPPPVLPTRPAPVPSIAPAPLRPVPPVLPPKKPRN